MRSKSVRLGVVLGVSLLAAAAARADFRLEKQFDLASGGSFSLRSSAGSVEVHGGDGSQAVVVITSDRSDFADLFDIRFDAQSDHLGVVIERKGGGFGFHWGFNGGAHVDVTLPKGVSADVHSSGGSVQISNLDGHVKAGSSGGSVHISDIGGDVDLSSSGGGVTVENVAGGAKVDSSGGSVVLRKVGGDIDSSSSGGGVRIEEAGGEVVAGSSGGPVHVSFAAGNDKGGNLHSSGGGVHVSLDSKVALDVDAHSSGGGIHCDLPITVRGHIGRGTLIGKLNGGGNVLRLRSSGGGISIEER